MNIHTVSIFAQFVVALSVAYVWVFRYENIVREFKHYGIADLLRNMVGAAKIVLATMLIVGVWYPALVLVPALLMAALMLCAQAAHAKVKNPLKKFIPSASLLILCLYIAGVSAGKI